LPKETKAYRVSEYKNRSVSEMQSLSTQRAWNSKLRRRQTLWSDRCNRLPGKTHLRNKLWCV